MLDTKAASLDQYSVLPCGYAGAVPLLRGHYLQSSRGRTSFWRGLYLPGAPGAVTFDGLIGVAGFGQPAREGVARALWKDTDPLPLTYELQRFYIAPGDHPENLGSWFLSRAVKALPCEVAMVVSFADPREGHHGGLYQATGWLYTGVTRGDPYHYVDAVSGRRIAKSTPWKLAKRQRDRGEYVDEKPVEGERRIAEERGWTKVRDKPKYRYVFPRTRFARRHLRLAVLPYPKPQRVSPAARSRP
jgi:hypothetical protein